MRPCSDEIYAKSTFKADSGFHSLATVLAQSGPELQAAGKALVHVVFGLSKDWYALTLSRSVHPKE